MPHRWISTSAVIVIALLLVPTPAAACPFCDADQPTFAQRRESADVVALAEVLSKENPADVPPVRIHAIWKGAELWDGRASLGISSGDQPAVGSLLVLLGSVERQTDTDVISWQRIEVDELAVDYFTRAPSLRMAATRRLQYFAKYLEHDHPLVAEDAYLEFAHAPYDIVAEVADQLPMPEVRRWLTDPAVTGRRKGLYGLVLGLSRDEAECDANQELLRRLIVAPAVDFRAGFDGILGGYLLAAGEPGLELIEQRILANPDAAEGDVRHAMNALRFYHESGRQIERMRLAEAARNMLARPEFAAATIVDLARWQDWGALESIMRLYDTPSTDHQKSIRRAIVGYLLVCPLDAASEHLQRIASVDPRLVNEVRRRPILPLRGD